MLQVESALDELKKDAEKDSNTGPVDLSAMVPSDEFHQGDVRIICLDKKLFDELRLTEITDFNGQVAPGSSQGSRHIIPELSNVKAYRMRDGNELDGPIIEASMPISVTHPEHGDCVNMPAGFYAFPGQRSYAEVLRRAAD